MNNNAAIQPSISIAPPWRQVSLAHFISIYNGSNTNHQAEKSAWPRACAEPGKPNMFLRQLTPSLNQSFPVAT